MTDYHDVRQVDAAKAFYVPQSHVNRSNGQELVPFASEADAGEFRKEQKGRRILVFLEGRAERPRSRTDRGGA